LTAAAGTSASVPRRAAAATGYNRQHYENRAAPGLVAILHEEIHGSRNSFTWTAVRTSVASIRQWLGNSRSGTAEGDTLVVETTKFHEDATFRFPADAATLRVVEHFRRVGRNAIDYQFTVDNPRCTRGRDGDAAMSEKRRVDLRVRLPTKA